METHTSRLLREDKGALAKLVEAVRTNYNDRHDEVGGAAFCRSLCGEGPLARCPAVGS